MLYNYVGVAAFAGLGVLMVIVPINSWASKKIEAFQGRQLAAKDQRIKLMSEVLPGVKVLKMYAWEIPFMESIRKVRDREVKMLNYGAYLWGVVVFTFSSTPGMMALAMFMTFCYGTGDEALTAEKIFVSLTLLNMIRIPLLILSLTIFNTVNMVVSFRRIGEFLNAEELGHARSKPDQPPRNPDNSIEMANSSYTWDDTCTTTLSNINLDIKNGELVAVVGLVGAGKSSLLSAMLGEMICLGEPAKVSGTTAYVAQQAWIQNLTVKGNILFGRAFRREFYDRVVRACGLLPDLKTLAAGDETEIGENGLNLSGGQKQRVALARAVYSDSDVYLLDDPLAALDAHVGQDVFRDVIGPGGLLDGKTRVLVTHNLTILKKVDTVLVMSDGKLAERGSYKELAGTKGGSFSDFLSQFSSGGDTTDPTDDLSEGSIESEDQPSSVHFDASDEKTPVAENDLPRQEMARLTEDESAAIGSVKWSVYLDYIRAIGRSFFTLTFVLYFISEGLIASANYSLTVWTNEPDTAGTTGRYMALYGGLSAAQSIIGLFKVVALFVACVNAACVIHENLLGKVMHSPMLFFDSTPSGRIINRFSSDVDVVDQTLPPQIDDFVACFMEMLFILLVISYSTPLFLATVPFLAAIFYFVQVFYLASSRQLRRLDMVSRSPVFSHFAETISGIVDNS